MRVPLGIGMCLSAMPLKNVDNKNEKEKKIPLPPFAERVQGGYDTRIRAFSTPEKVFEAFASINKGRGHKLMTWEDFRRAILPYDVRPDKMKKEFRRSDRPVFLVDLIDKIERADPLSDPSDDFIALAPWLFVDNLLAIPVNDWALAFNMFDENEDGHICETEFRVLLEHFRLDSFSAKRYDYAFIAPLFRELFGDGQTDTNKESILLMDQFDTFLTQLRLAILEMEFESYSDPSIGESMSGKDFCVSLCGYADHRQLPWYVARINRMPSHLRSIKVSLDEFIQFNLALNHLDRIIDALKIHSELKDPQKDSFNEMIFARAVKVVTGYQMRDDLSSLIFYLFDTNNDKKLDYNEIYAVLGNRFSHGRGHTRTSGFTKYVSCFKDCFKSNF